MELISVIVPVYNVEKYLDRCVQSIVDQTYSNLEIILVDDGSPDNCPAMCDAWSEKDSRIKVIHKENGGLSDARNTGLEVATGELIAFVDSDDWLDPLFYATLINAMHTHNCDIVAGGFRKVSTRKILPHQVQQKKTIVLNSQDALFHLIREDSLQQVVWNKLYKKRLISGIPFARGKYHEDEFWSYQVIGRSTRVAIVDYTGYYYYQRPDSIMGTAFSEKRLDAIEAKCLRQNYLTVHYPELVSCGLVSLYFNCMYLGQQALRTLDTPNANQTLKKLKEALKLHPITSSSLRYQQLSHYIWLLLANRSLTAACILRNVLRIGL